MSKQTPQAEKDKTKTPENKKDEASNLSMFFAKRKINPPLTEEEIKIVSDQMAQMWIDKLLGAIAYQAPNELHLFKECAADSNLDPIQPWGKIDHKIHLQDRINEKKLTAEHLIKFKSELKKLIIAELQKNKSIKLATDLVPEGKLAEAWQDANKKYYFDSQYIIFPARACMRYHTDENVIVYQDIDTDTDLSNTTKQDFPISCRTVSDRPQENLPPQALETIFLV